VKFLAEPNPTNLSKFRCKIENLNGDIDGSVSLGRKNSQFHIENVDDYRLFCRVKSLLTTNIIEKSQEELLAMKD
jgi:hypothetical protein